MVGSYVEEEFFFVVVGDDEVLVFVEWVGFFNL